MLGAAIAAGRAPHRVRSLTLIEPPLYDLVPRDPDVAHLERIGNAVLADGMATAPATLREFLRLADATISDALLPDAVVNGLRSYIRIGSDTAFVTLVVAGHRFQPDTSA